VQAGQTILERMHGGVRNERKKGRKGGEGLRSELLPKLK